MSDIAKKALEQIKEEKISPEPKWKFLLKNWVYWGVFGLTIVLGSLSFSVVFFVIKGSDWDIFPRLNQSFIGFALFILPRFWIIAVFLFLFLAILNFRHTKHGYRLSPSFIVSLSIILSVLIGGLLSYAKVGEYLDNLLFENSPAYEKIAGSHRNVWENPEKGLLGGIVVSLDLEKNKASVVDRKRHIWDVDLQGLEGDAEGLSVNFPARFIGNQTGPFSFSAEEIRPGKIGSPFAPIKLMHPSSDSLKPFPIPPSKK
ncbi:MAG: hypothetical protein PHZ25_02520 [Candidatus Pacebacteria bacterium]|nr:hypothetical protein [Candidatus Paceibacterota bacterium]